MKGWLDNFGKADNANNSKVSMSEDFVGLGYNTEGRNYSPAWGGQFQDGGYIDSVLNANKKLDWVQRLYEENTPSIKIKGQKGKATHFMESSDGRAYPTVVRMADGKLKYLGDDAYDYADKTKTYIQFPSDREAQLFSENYKKGTNVLKDFQIGGKLNPISPTQQIQQAVEPTPTVPYLQTKDPAEFYKSWIQSPEYERRQLLTGYSEGEDLYMPNAAASRESRLGAIEEMTPITYSARQPSEAKPGVYGSPSYVNINPSDYVGTSKEAIQAHELAHIAGAMGEVRPGMMSGAEQDIFKKSMLPMKEPVLSGVQGSKEREASVRALEDFKHSQEPDEAKADLDALRFMMYDKGIYDITKGKKFTETDFQKAKQNLGNDRVFKRLENRMGKENFVKLMNTIALADDQEEAPIAMGGMSIPGSVGFSYARVAGAAPSKGKYAKKTMASAQNGIMSPMLLARNVLNYFYPNEEAAPAVEAVEAAPVNYKKGLTNELLQRQAYKESTFNPAAVSPAGYKGLTQIGDSILKDYSKKKGGKKLDPFNPEDAVELQKFAMDNLYNSDFINKPNQPDSVRIAKTLAAYNWGRGNLSNYLHEQKNKGVDIYDSYDWLNNLPKETSDYVNKILLQEDPSFNKNYKKASTNPKYEEVTSLYDQKKFGGDIPSAQNGQEMKFYQNGLDWKPRSMQPGGNIERVSTSDPRYPELYKNRQVGAYYDGAYSLPDLPEVVVTGKDERLKEAMYEGSNKFGMNALGLMSAPQVVTMEALTGKQQTPSEAFGFQQPGGWLDSPTSFGKNLGNFAMDAVLDPVNLLGIGVADDLLKAGVKKIAKNASNNPLQVSEQLLKNQNFPRSISELTSTGFKKDPYFHYNTFIDKKADIVEKLNTNEGRRRIENLVSNNPHLQELWKTTDDLIDDFQSTKFETSSPVYDRQLNDYKKHSDGSLVYEPVNPNNAYNWYRDSVYKPSYVSMGMNYTPYDASHILEHEFAHTFQRGNELSGIDDVLSNIELKPYFATRFREMIPNLNPFNKNYDKGYSESGKIYGTHLGFDNISRDRALTNAKNYFLTGSGRGQEKAAFSAEVRENLMQRGLLKDRYDEITPEMLKKHYDLYKNTKGNKYNLRLYDIMTGNKENFSYLSEALNRLPAMVPPSALPYVGLGGAGYAGMKGLEEQKYGGVIKDDRGQWAHPGKVTEIDSNYITMDGVPYDVLGVSDTGDTKLMKPGKNYKFKGKKVTEFPVAQEGTNEIPREQYLSKFKTYDNVLKSMNYTTPYYKDNNIDTSEGGMNCINGVCSIISNISGVKFDKAQTKDTYTGNATFADNAMDEGYYKSNPEKEGFGTGDIFQYSRKKGSMASRFPGEVNFKNENDLYPNHAVLIVNEFEKDGQKYFKIANNSGNDKVTLEDISESELMDRYKKGYKTYDGGITYRYDPDKVTSIKKENQEKVNVLKGSNPYAGQYSKYDSSNLSFYNNQVDNLKMTDQLGVDKNLQKYADVYSTVYKDLGKGSNMPIDSFNKLILNQIGIAGQETKFGELASNSKDLIPDSLLPVARRSREIYNYNFGTNDNWKKDYWEKNAENVQKEFGSYEDFVKSFKSEDSDYNPYRTPRSIGVFQQKDLSERGNFYNYDLDSFEGQVKSSLALAVDNYHKLKAKYPDLSEEQIIDLTTLMHNAPGKALEPRFVNYYLKNKDVDYIDKVKSFTPKTISKKPSTTKKNEEIKFEEVSPEKAKSMVDYVNSLQQKKRNGGGVGINELDAQPMKKLNQLLNFTNNPDKDNWLDKYN